MDTLCKKKLLLQVICLGVGLLYSTTLGAADSVEEARELAKAKTLNNEERHSDLVRTGSIIPNNEQSVGAALHHYNYDNDSSSLALLTEILNPDTGESRHTLSVLKRIKLDSKTTPILYEYAVGGGSSFISAALIRLSEAPSVDGIEQADLLKIEELFEGIENGTTNYGETFRIKSASAHKRFKNLLEGRGKSEPKMDVHAPVESIEIPATAPEVEEVAEVIEEVTAPKPTIEEPAEVVVTEPIQEDVEPSSNWRPWLVGALVVVGGVLLLRSKSNGSPK